MRQLRRDDVWFCTVTPPVPPDLRLSFRQPICRRCSPRSWTSCAPTAQGRTRGSTRCSRGIRPCVVVGRRVSEAAVPRVCSSRLSAPLFGCDQWHSEAPVRVAVQRAAARGAQPSGTCLALMPVPLRPRSAQRCTLVRSARGCPTQGPIPRRTRASGADQRARRRPDRARCCGGPAALRAGTGGRRGRRIDLLGEEEPDPDERSRPLPVPICVVPPGHRVGNGCDQRKRTRLSGKVGASASEIT
jgi:hypothetical protein